MTTPLLQELFYDSHAFLIGDSPAEMLGQWEGQLALELGRREHWSYWIVPALIIVSREHGRELVDARTVFVQRTFCWVAGGNIMPVGTPLACGTLERIAAARTVMDMTPAGKRLGALIALRREQ